MAGIGPFIPHPDTPLKNAKGRAFTLSLKTMAITRLLLPDINIPATTAMEALRPNGRLIALQSGANVIMPNVTDLNYCKLYELYPGNRHPLFHWLNNATSWKNFCLQSAGESERDMAGIFLSALIISRKISLFQNQFTGCAVINKSFVSNFLYWPIYLSIKAALCSINSLGVWRLVAFSLIRVLLYATCVLHKI